MIVKDGWNDDSTIYCRNEKYTVTVQIKATGQEDQYLVITGKIVKGKKGKANRCILRSILLPEDFPENSIQGNQCFAYQ